MSSFLLILALCGDGGYKPQPTIIHFDYVIVQDCIDIEETLLTEKVVVRYRLMNLFNWYDDVGLVYEGWLLMRRDGYPYDNRYQFFQKFKGTWWEIRMDSIDYEMSERSVERFYPHSPNRTQLKESGS